MFYKLLTLKKESISGKLKWVEQDIQYNREDCSEGCASCEGTGIEPSCDACHDKGYTLKPGYDGVWRNVVCKECENNALQGS